MEYRVHSTGSTGRLKRGFGWPLSVKFMSLGPSVEAPSLRCRLVVPGLMVSIKVAHHNAGSLETPGSYLEKVVKFL